MKHYNRVLTIAGSDSGGGAGIQADIKTIQSLGCYAMSAITAVTVQNTMGVRSVFPVPADVVGAQIDAVLEDIGADAIKIGMLQSRDTVRSVVECLRRYGIKNVVLDPVMVSTSGKRLLEEDAISIMTQELFPLVRAITPNIPEAELLLGEGIESTGSAMSSAAKALSEKYGVSVLLKAGHANLPHPLPRRGESQCVEDLSGREEVQTLVDFFYDRENDVMVQLPARKVNSKNTHGTGCTMSSAFASYLAMGKSLQEAARGAKEYINNAIIMGAEYEIGHGHGPVKHTAPPQPSPVREGD